MKHAIVPVICVRLNGSIFFVTPHSWMLRAGIDHVRSLVPFAKRLGKAFKAMSAMRCQQLTLDLLCETLRPSEIAFFFRAVLDGSDCSPRDLDELHRKELMRLFFLVSGFCLSLCETPAQRGDSRAKRKSKELLKCLPDFGRLLTNLGTLSAGQTFALPALPDEGRRYEAVA